MASGPPPIKDAPEDGRRILGELLQQRRIELGYARRTAFARKRLLLLRSGEPNIMLLDNIEHARRDNFSEPTLRLLAQVYRVTYESLVNVAHLKDRILAPAHPGTEGRAREPGGLPIEDAPEEGRVLLGALLAQRRKELGYTHWPAFARDRLPLTPMGNPNTRMLADIEKAYRKRFPEPTLRQLARAYLVNYRSLLDVAHLRRNTLIPVSPDDAPAEPPAEPPGWAPPVLGAAHPAAVRPYADRIWERLRQLALRGVADPDGGQVFGPGTPDAKTWDGTGARGLDLPDRVWLVADLQRWGDARAAGSEATSAGA